MAGCCEFGNEHSGCMNVGEHVDKLRHCQLVKKDSAQWSSIS